MLILLRDYEPSIVSICHRYTMLPLYGSHLLPYSWFNDWYKFLWQSSPLLYYWLVTRRLCCIVGGLDIGVLTTDAVLWFARNKDLRGCCLSFSTALPWPCNPLGPLNSVLFFCIFVIHLSVIGHILFQPWSRLFLTFMVDYIEHQLYIR